VAAEPRLMTSLDYSFKPATEWRVGAGHVLKFEYVNHKETLIHDQGTTVFVLSYPEVVHSIIASENERALLVLVNTIRKSGGYDYTYVLTVQELQNHTLAFQRWLPAGRDPMRKYRWVVELGAISDDANIALIKVGEPDRDEAPYTVGKVWETWNLKEARILKTGLTIRN
jgi:hypothetical protein